MKLRYKFRNKKLRNWAMLVVATAFFVGTTYVLTFVPLTVSFLHMAPIEEHH